MAVSRANPYTLPVRPKRSSPIMPKKTHHPPPSIPFPCQRSGAAAIDLICESHGGELYFTDRMEERL